MSEPETATIEATIIGAAAENPADAFIESRKDLQLEVSLGRRLLETYAAQIGRVLERITLLRRQTQDGRVADATAIVDARHLAMTADALATAARDRMELTVRPIVDRHGPISPPEAVNQALVQGWGDNFYQLVRAEYDRATVCLEGIDQVRDRVHETRTAIARLGIREAA